MTVYVVYISLLTPTPYGPAVRPVFLQCLTLANKEWGMSGRMPLTGRVDSRHMDHHVVCRECAFERVFEDRASAMDCWAAHEADTGHVVRYVGGGADDVEFAPTVGNAGRG